MLYTRVQADFLTDFKSLEFPAVKTRIPGAVVPRMNVSIWACFTLNRARCGSLLSLTYEFDVTIASLPVAQMHETKDAQETSWED